MPFNEIFKLLIKLAIHFRKGVIRSSTTVKLVHQVMDQLEVVQVIDLLLFHGSIKDFSPNLLIIPLDVV